MRPGCVYSSGKDISSWKGNLMRKSAALLFTVLVCSLGFSGRASAQSVVRQDVPPILTSGMEAYKPGNAEQAIKDWTKNSPLEGTQAGTDAINNLRHAQSIFGPFQWFDIIFNREISPRVRIIYLSMNYENGPLFSRFVFYRTDRGWIVSAFDFNLDDTKILPLTVE
jgi:hypothetical protein